ncbi:MAG: germination protein YpeB [Ruminococcus sp.]|nr:germination protein YpeB [Ruminococcus sp.]
MKLTKRMIIRAFSYLAAAVGVLGAKDLILMNENESLSLEREYTYTRAVGDLSDELDTVSSTLEKQLYASGAEIHRDLSVKLCSDTAEAKSALAQLPNDTADLGTVNKFLSQVGDYSLSLSKKLTSGGEISDKEYKNIEQLYSVSKELCEKMRLLRESVESGETVFVPDADIRTPLLSDGYEELDEAMSGCPKLIYDGPFSDNILERTPMMTRDAEKVTRQQALTRCRMVLGIDSNDLSVIDTVSGRMPGWRFSDSKGGISCEVTEKGGYLSYFLRSRQPEASKLSTDEALQKAENFLTELGMDSLKSTYYETYSNVLTVNFAYQDLDVLCYTDLVKVSVALDNGEILGYDAKGWLVNHHKRQYRRDIISLSSAAERVSPKLTVESSQKALIPADDLSEKLCYEFRCKADNGRTALVYINAETGREEQILLLVESEYGVLTV